MNIIGEALWIDKARENGFANAIWAIITKRLDPCGESSLFSLLV